jgi:hypothetical protein
MYGFWPVPVLVVVTLHRYQIFSPLIVRFVLVYTHTRDVELSVRFVGGVRYNPPLHCVITRICGPSQARELFPSCQRAFQRWVSSVKQLNAHLPAFLDPYDDVLEVKPTPEYFK